MVREVFNLTWEGSHYPDKIRQLFQELKVSIKESNAIAEEVMLKIQYFL